jgi:hypothetical protein
MPRQLCRTRVHRLHILDGMKITPEVDDSPDFVRQVEQVANGVIRLHAPETLVLTKIDNYFGTKWLGFSGKALERSGFGTIPPITPQTASGSHPSYQIGSYHNGGFPVQPMKKSIAVSRSTSGYQAASRSTVGLPLLYQSRRWCGTAASLG